MDNLDLQIIANEVRKDVLREVYAAKAGHPGGSLSAADIETYLFFEGMDNIGPENTDNPDRDRFVLSKGHSCPSLYGVMAEKGYFPKTELRSYRKLGSRLQGHPSIQYLPGIDMSSGSLGQGISAAAGMALSAKMDGKSFRVYTLIGDGELEEGEVWEAAMFAGAKKLDNLCVIVDNNNLQIDGKISKVNNPYPIGRKFPAFNFHVIMINGHDFNQIRTAFKEARRTKGCPTAIIAKTVKGRGVSFMENKAEWHGKAPDDGEYAIAMNELDHIGEVLAERKKNGGN